MQKEFNHFTKNEQRFYNRLDALSNVITIHKHSFKNNSDIALLEILDRIKKDFYELTKEPKSIYMLEEIYENQEKECVEVATHVFSDEKTARNVFKAQALRELACFKYRGYTEEELKENGSKFYEDGVSDVYYQTDTYCTFYTLHCTTPLTEENVREKLLDIIEEEKRIKTIIAFRDKEERTFKNGK